MPTNITTYTPCQGKVSLGQVARCHGHACPRHVAFGRVSDVPIMLVQDVLSTAACPFQNSLLTFKLDRHLLLFLC